MNREGVKAVPLVVVAKFGEMLDRDIPAVLLPGCVPAEGSIDADRGGS